MKQKIYQLIASLLILLLFSALTLPDEGMWMMNQLTKLDWGKMQKTGLTLTPEQIYNPNGPSLKDAIVLLGGGTSSFISAEGSCSIRCNTINKFSGRRPSERRLLRQN